MSDETPKDRPFERNSIASFVFDPRAAQISPGPRARTIAPGSIAALVFRHAGSSPSVKGILTGAVVAATLGSALAMSAWAAPPEAKVPVVTSEPMRLEHVVELAPEEPAEPEPSANAARRVETRKRLPKPDAPGAKPPPPAQAGKLVAVQPESSLDFTDQSIVTADHAKFAGGVTAPSGTNTDAVRTSTVDPNARPGGPQGEGSLARSVRLPARNWHCPWPKEAEMLGITEQTVVIRVMVDETGASKTVTLLADPGHGFGNATVACARTAKFEPARDEDGRPYAATSPPIRVRFTR